MKNRILLLAAASTLGFAACNQSTDGQYTQEQLDSIVNYKVDSIEYALKLQNDSLISAMADSLAAKGVAVPPAAKAASSRVKSESRNPSSVKTTDKEAVPVERPAADTRTQADIAADKKAARFGDEDAKARLEQDAADKKAARFGDEEAKARVEQTAQDKKAERFNR